MRALIHLTVCVLSGYTCSRYIRSGRRFYWTSFHSWQTFSRTFLFFFILRFSFVANSPFRRWGSPNVSRSTIVYSPKQVFSHVWRASRRNFRPFQLCCVSLRTTPNRISNDSASPNREEFRIGNEGEKKCVDGVKVLIGAWHGHGEPAKKLNRNKSKWIFMLFNVSMEWWWRPWGFVVHAVWLHVYVNALNTMWKICFSVYIWKYSERILRSNERCVIFATFSCLMQSLSFRW